ncbi:MAG: diguanylate cyclase [Gammaproteobacteria bacterium]|nr:diguanylate cyclase [Gammaproteobacteria bacterium]MBU1480113.1 diguanylate cyclase [Gammaproteobacteria bacterium]
MNAFTNGWRATGVQEKLHILIQGTLIILFFVTMEWVLGRFEVQIERAAETRAEETANGLINGMNMLMLTGKISDPENRKLLLDKMSQSRGVAELRIIRGRAVVEQFGPGLPEEAATDDMDREVLSTGRTLFRKLTLGNGHSALRVVVPFIAKQDFRGTNCLSCHVTNAGSVNGAASVVIDLSDEDSQLAEIEDWLWIGHIVLQILLLVIISLFVRIVIVRNITNPIRNLQHTMAEIQADLDFSRRADVNVDNPDIGEMARNFNILVEKLEHANERLQLFVKMFDNSGEAIFITDAQQKIIAVNPACYKITGYPEEEFIGHNPNILNSGRQDEQFYKAMWKSINDTGLWQGEIWNRRKNGEIYPEWLSIGTVKNSQNEIINYIAVFSDITRRKEDEAHIEHLAHYDSLTHLPNRALFADRLKHALVAGTRNKTKTALLFLDLDRFKYVNDTMGHVAGDRLLQSVAERLKSCVRESDTICRQGGDEFMILLPDGSDTEDAEKVARKIIGAMEIPHQIGEKEVVITFSIGISICPDDATDEDMMIKHADDAMYMAKDSGRNNYKIFVKAGPGA